MITPESSVDDRSRRNMQQPAAVHVPHGSHATYSYAYKSIETINFGACFILFRPPHLGALAFALRAVTTLFAIHLSLLSATQTHLYASQITFSCVYRWGILLPAIVHVTPPRADP